MRASRKAMGMCPVFEVAFVGLGGASFRADSGPGWYDREVTMKGPGAANSLLGNSV